MISVKRTKLINTLLQTQIKSFNNKPFNYSALKFLTANQNKDSQNHSGIKTNKKSNHIFGIFPNNNFNSLLLSGVLKKYFSNSQPNQNPIDNKNYSNNANANNKSISLSNENFCFLKKLNNFRNNGVEYNVYNTECVFQTIWSDFAYVCYANESKTFHNNLEKSNIDFTKTDDDSFTIFQDESAFVDFEEKDKTEHYMYETENEASSTLQKFRFSNLNKNTTAKDKFCLLTRIPQEFNISLNTNKSVKIVNMGDSKLLGDKEIKINFTHFSNIQKHEECEKSGEAVNLEMRRVRSNNICLTSEKGFKVKLTARSYLEAESLKISFPTESVLRVKKIGVAINGIINLRNSELDMRSVFSPNKDINTDEKGESASNAQDGSGPQLTKSLEFSCEDSNLTIGSLQGNNYFNLNSCNLIIDNVDCDNFILKSSNTKSLEIFINSLDKLEENEFFYLNFTEDSCENNKNKFANEDMKTGNLALENLEAAKNKKIYLNQENKNAMLIVKVNSAVLKLLKSLNKEESEFSNDSELQSKLFSIMHGESNFLSLLIENNRNLYDTDQINMSFVQYLRDNSIRRDSILGKLKANNLFSGLDATEKDVAENLMLVNHYLLNVLLKDIPNSYRIIFVDAQNTESIEIKEMSAWDITKKRIQNKMNIAHKRVNS